ncbi:hypothetical protein HDU93_000730 [Gonapodya sp. JEL0774]|nr:hypothetical protein HDU93_000730 [Gonapodya sp. JEL0774]
MSDIVSLEQGKQGIPTSPDLPSLPESELEHSNRKQRELSSQINQQLPQNNGGTLRRVSSRSALVTLTVSSDDASTIPRGQAYVHVGSSATAGQGGLKVDRPEKFGSDPPPVAETSQIAQRRAIGGVNTVNSANGAGGGIGAGAGKPTGPGQGRRSSRVNFALPPPSTNPAATSGNPGKPGGTSTGSQAKHRAQSPKSVSLPAEMNRRPSVVPLNLRTERTSGSRGSKDKDKDAVSWSKSPAAMRAGQNGPSAGGASRDVNGRQLDFSSAPRSHSGADLPNTSSPPLTSSQAHPLSALGLSQDDQDFSLSYRFYQRFPHMSLQARHRALTLILRQCDPLDFLFINDQLPKLHRDFLGVLPPHLAQRILTHVHPRDLCTVVAASRKHAELVRDQELWRTLYASIGLRAMADLYHVARQVSSHVPVLLNARRLLHLSNWVRGRFRRRTVHASDLAILTCHFDGRTVVTGGADKVLRSWDVSSGRLLKEFKGHEEAVFCAQFDEGKLVSGGADGAVKVWSVLSGAEVYSVPAAHKSTVNCLKFTGTILVTGSADKVSLVNVGPPTCLRTLHGHTAGVKCLDFTHVLLVSGSGDGVVRVWQLASGNLLHTFEPSPITAVAPSTGPERGNVLPASTGSAVSPVQSPISSLRLSPTRLVISTLSGHVFMYTVAPIPPKISAPGFPQTAVFEALRRWLQVEGGMKVAGVYDLFREKRKEGKKGDDNGDYSEDSEDEPVERVSGRSQWFQSGTDTAQSSGAEESQSPQSGSMSGSPDGSTLNSLSSPSASPSSPVQTRRLQHRHRAVHGMSTWALTVSADEWRLMAGGSEGTVKIWNHRLGTEIYSLSLTPAKPSTPHPTPQPPSGGSFPSGDSLEQEPPDGDGTSAAENAAPKAVTGVAFDDGYIVVAGTDGIVRIWQTDTE